MAQNITWIVHQPKRRTAFIVKYRIIHAPQNKVREFTKAAKNLSPETENEVILNITDAGKVFSATQGRLKDLRV